MGFVSRRALRLPARFLGRRLPPLHPGDHAAGQEPDEGDPAMIILGIILLILGLLLSVPVLWVIGLVLVAVGAILWIVGTAGHEIGGRRHYY
jgi:hypothetical protein